MSGKDDDILYGECKWCEEFLPRNEMISVNVKIYAKGVHAVDSIIRWRMCKDCYDREMKKWKSKEWDKRLYKEEEIPAR